jgi:hypothetical protein
MLNEKRPRFTGAAGVTGERWFTRPARAPGAGAGAWRHRCR